MQIRFFHAVRYPGDWELNFIGKHLNFRVGRSQIAFWRDYEPIFDIHMSGSTTP